MTDGSRLDDRTVRVVLVLVAVGLLARFALLGWRVAHYDEGRVAFWALNYLETGQFHYRYIIHGPFIQHVDRWLFAILGPTDFVSRVPVALVTGLLPLVALWFRHHLSDTEVAALAFFLAFNPIVLYYSRFMRSSMLVAAFALVSFAAFVRWYDGFGVGYFYAGVAMLALAFAAKENAVVYVLSWLGAGALVLHHKMVRHEEWDSGLDWLQGAVAEGRRRVEGPDGDRLRWSVVHLVGGLVIFVAIALFFYAPRGGVTDPGALAITRSHPRYDQIVATCRQVGLWKSLFSGEVGDLAQCTTLTIEQGYFGYWFGGPGDTTFKVYTKRLGKFVETMVSYAAPLFALAVAGTVVEHYVSEEPRYLVLGVAYWGFAAIVGYPLGTDIWAAWIIVNALVPLAIPAAVGLTLILDAGRDALADDDRISLAAVAVLLLLVVAQIGIAGVGGVYLAPTSPDNGLVQFAQPQQSMRPAMTEMAGIAARNQGPDALVYGAFADGDVSVPRTPACVDWFASLPLAWYLESDDVDTVCAQNASQIPSDVPPVVVAKATCRVDTNDDGTPDDAPATYCRDRPEAIQGPAELRERIPQNYEKHAFLLRTTAKPVVVYVDPGA